MKKRDKKKKVIDTIIIGCDHSGHSQKKELINIIQKDYDVKIIDVGTDDNKSCHYTDFAHKGCQMMNDTSRLILMCTTGTGMNMVANKYPGIRCVHGHTVHQVGMSRKHNNANALAMGVALNQMSDMKAMVQTFIDTDFEECDADGNPTRHSIRVNKIEDDLPNKIEHTTTTNVSTDNNTYMSTSSNDKDVTHTDIFKPQKARKAMSLGNMRKRDHVYPVQVKLNDKPFQPRELPPPPPEDTMLFTKTNFFIKNETLESEPSETNSLKVQVDSNDLEDIINDKIENAQLLNAVNEHDEMEHKPLSTNQDDAPVLVMTKDVDIINDIEKERLSKLESGRKANKISGGDKYKKPQDKQDINDYLSELDKAKYVPSSGEPVRKLPSDEKEINIDIDDLDDDEVFVNVPVPEATTRDEVKREEVKRDEVKRDEVVDVSKENVKAEQKMALRNEAKQTLAILKDLQEHEKRKEKEEPKRKMPVRPTQPSSLVPVKVDSIPKASKVAFNPNAVPRNVAFNPNNSVKMNPNSTQKDVKVKTKKIESSSRSVQRSTSIINTTSTMSNKLDYPDSIDTDNTKMATMVNYMNNCNEASKLQQAIMRQIVELRERMKLVSRDLKAEMDCVFDLSEETQETDTSL